MSKRRRRPGTGIGVGIAIGVALGVALDQLALGLALGVALGAAFDWRPGGGQSPDGEDANPKNVPISDPDGLEGGPDDISGGD